MAQRAEVILAQRAPPPLEVGGNPTAVAYKSLVAATATATPAIAIATFCYLRSPCSPRTCSQPRPSFTAVAHHHGVVCTWTHWSQRHGVRRRRVDVACPALSHASFYLRRQQRRWPNFQVKQLPVPPSSSLLSRNSSTSTSITAAAAADTFHFAGSRGSTRGSCSCSRSSCCSLTRSSATATITAATACCFLCSNPHR